MGMDSPVGKTIYADRRRIIGVVEDYHYMPLDSRIEPIVLSFTDRYIRYLFIRLTDNALDFNKIIQFIESEYMKHENQYPFEYQFLEDYLDGIYFSEDRLKVLIRYFSILAILISCLGLFGLSSFTLQQRRKEVGIRKAMGAGSEKIFSLFIIDFLKLILASFILSFPIAYFIMNSWLQNFAYKMEITIWIFIVAGILGILIAVCTVGYQSLKASGANPVQSLRYE